MKVSQAPVYVRAFDLAQWLLERADGFPQELPSGRTLAGQLQSQALALLNGVARALTFRAGRREQLQAVNESLLELRMALRLAQRCQHLEQRQVRYAMKQIDDIGRMVGGWQRQEQADAPRIEWESVREA